MRKMTVLLMIMLVLCLTAGVSQGEQEAAAVEIVTTDVMPLPMDPDSVDLTNGTFCVNLEDIDRIDEDGYLTLALYRVDEYTPEQIEHLAPGTTILVNGEKYTVAEEVVPRDIGWVDEEIITWDVMTEEECWGGLWFIRYGENYAAYLDDWNPCTLVARIKVALPLPDRFVLYVIPGGMEPVPYTAEDFLARLREGDWDIYNQYNSTATFENGELVDITVAGYPHGPDTGEIEDDA